MSQCPQCGAQMTHVSHHLGLMLSLPSSCLIWSKKYWLVYEKLVQTKKKLTFGLKRHIWCCLSPLWVVTRQEQTQWWLVTVTVMTALKLRCRSAGPRYDTSIWMYVQSKVLWVSGYIVCFGYQQVLGSIHNECIFNNIIITTNKKWCDMQN